MVSRSSRRWRSVAAERPEGDPLRYRIGVHVGDVIIDGEDIFGDGVNIAARIEGLAEPGGVAISDAVNEHVRGRVEVAFVDRGEHEVKNIARPLHVWGWNPNGTVAGAVASIDAAEPDLPDKPSIAVLPFNNMSGDPEQGYFADGITEDIITDLSKVSGLFVIARNSSFAYKGQAPDIRRVSRELGVRYVLEGSVRRAAGRVRINAQMIDGHDRRPPLGRTLRSRPGGHLRGAGRGDPHHRDRVESEAHRRAR